MKKQKRAIPAALLALCLLLAACGEKQSGGPAEAPAAAAYTSELSALDLPLTELTASAASGGNAARCRRGGWRGWGGRA